MFPPDHRLLPACGAALGLTLLIACTDPDPAATDAAGGDSAAVWQPDAADVRDPDIAGPELSEEIAQPSYCDSDSHATYDPLGGGVQPQLPDDAHTLADPASPTGRRVAVDLTAPWVDQFADYRPSIEALNTLDGWGTTAGVIVRFDAPIGETPEPASSTTSPALALYALPAEGEPERVPYEARLTDEGHTLIAWPMRPLSPATEHLIVATTALRDAAGDCYRPSETLQALLEGRPPEPLGETSARLIAALDRVGVAPSEVSSARVFTTQTIVDESVAIAAAIASLEVTWSSPPTCETLPLFRRCEGTFVTRDFRQQRVITDGRAATVHAEYALPVRVWLPLAETAEPPYPVVIYGHGLGSGRSQGGAVADRAAPRGVATVAIDAVAQNEHPDSAGAGVAAMLSLFGIDPATSTLSPLVLRDNWRQSAYDKLQLVQLITDDPDADGDGAPDLDASRLGYIGASLGGTMGPELLALSDRFQMSVLSVPGGRLASIISDSQTFGPLIEAMRPAEATEGDVQRFFPVLQTLIERGDGSNYGRHVFVDRLDDATGPHLLVQMAIDDTIMPNSTTRSLIRALELPVLPPVLQEVGLVEVTPPAPISGNLAEGQLTGALFQFDRVTRSSGALEAATHDTTTSSEEGLHQIFHFMETWLADGTPQLIDPYTALGTPALP